MKPIAWDTETELITERAPLPRVVCLSYAVPNGEGRAVSDLVHRPHVPEMTRALLESRDRLVLHQSDYDLGVTAEQDPSLLPLIFETLDDGRITDTKVRAQLADIASGAFERKFRTKGSWSLERLALEFLGWQLDKGEDGWRLRYGELIDVPVEAWPREARDYATGDAASTLLVWLGQERRFDDGYRPPDELLQVRAQFALKLMSAAGVVADRAAVDAFELDLLEQLVALEGDLKSAGVVSAKGSRVMAAIRDRVESAYAKRGESPPCTPKGAISTAEDVIDTIAHLDPILMRVVEYARVQKQLGSFVPVVRAASEHPVFADFNYLVETGRTSCRGMELENVEGKKRKRGTNWQQLPRAKGARECVRARDGNVLVLVDYEVAELRALAQICYVWLGWSHLRESFIAGQDPHLLLGAQLLGISYADAAARKKAGDTAVDNARQFAKIPNFGMAGGMGARAFCEYARGYGYRLEVDRHTQHEGRDIPSATELKHLWHRQWPEMKSYFAIISEITSEAGSRCIEQLGSGRRRGDVGFTDASNGMFQGLVADMAKVALYLVTRACYVGGGALLPGHTVTPLLGCLPILFVHDEIILEAPEEQAADAAEECRLIMEAVQETWMPDVPAAAEAKLARRWSKSAKPTRDRHGRLIPWEDRTR